MPNSVSQKGHSSHGEVVSRRSLALRSGGGHAVASMTYSIVALDDRTGELGVAVQTRWLAVGALVPWLRPGVGAIATQSFVDTRYGFSGIELLAAGRTPEDALAELLAADSDPGVRQVGMVDAAGRSAAHTGADCVVAAGHLTGPGVTVQANMMERPTVWPAMLAAFQGTSGDLADRLVAMGFEEMEAVQAVQAQLDGDLFGERPPQPTEVRSTMTLPEAAAKALADAAPSAVSLEKSAEGLQVTLRGVLPQAALDAAVAAVPKREREAAERELQRHQTRAHAAAAPAQRGERFSPVPLLCLPVQGEIALVDPDLLNELAAFSLAGQSADLPGFVTEEGERPYLIDVDQGHVKIRQDDGQYGLDLDASQQGIRREDVIRELDRRVRRGDLLQADMIGWLGRMLDGLVAQGIELTYMARHLNALSDAVVKRLRALEQERRNQAFQTALFGGATRACLSDHYQFKFDPNVYPARWLFEGRYQFRKHFYPLPGELKPEIDREETACAIEIDSLEEVKFWVRNLERQPEASFWLPTSTDRFYPDFVAQLDDGRVLVVEYKGAVYLSNDDTKEKQTIGAVWAAASKGRCVFAMVTDAASAGKSVAAQLKAALP